MNDDHLREPEASSDAKASPSSSTSPGSERRTFMQWSAAALSGLLGLIPAAIGGVFLFDPLLRAKRNAGEAASGGEAGDGTADAEGFVPLGLSADALPDDGTPVAVKVRADQVDAWNRFQDVEVGTVWLRLNDDQEVVAFSSICPHLGCAVDFRSTNQDFFCPCHTSSFALNGERTNQIPPRGMDRLEVRTKPETGDLLWIKYETFRAGTPEKIKIS